MIVNLTKNKKAVSSNIESEKEFLSNYLKTQERINLNINSILKKYVASFEISTVEDSKELSNHLSSIFHMQNKSFFNIDSINALIKKLNNIDLSSDDYLKRIESYNSSYLKLVDKILKNTTTLELYIIESSKTDLSSSDNDDSTVVSSSVEEKEKNVFKNTTEVKTTGMPPEEASEPIDLFNIANVESQEVISPAPDEKKTSLNLIKQDADNTDDTTCENTLVVSELDNKVVLPYTMEDLYEIINKNPNKYKSVTEVIDSLYTRPLRYYKHSSVARFKEAYNLVRNRQHGSIAQALDLAFELFSNYNLHPAIISACKNVDELDVYLSCLQYNELNDFHFFKTIFKLNPTLAKNEHN